MVEKADLESRTDSQNSFANSNNTEIKILTKDFKFVRFSDAEYIQCYKTATDGKANYSTFSWEKADKL